MIIQIQKKKYDKNLELRMFRPEFVMFTPFPGNVLCVFLCVHFSIWQIKKKKSMCLVTTMTIIMSGYDYFVDFSTKFGC